MIYPEDGLSHFRMWHDNVRITAMHTRLVLGMRAALHSAHHASCAAG